MESMKIAIVHDDLMQWGGAERVLLAISEVFPDAPIYTSVINLENPLITESFKDKKIITSFIQKIPGWKSFYKAFLPLYPLAFEQFDFSEYDLVITQTTRFAKCIITKPKIKHVCYCHTPPRFLWNFSGEMVNGLLTPLLTKLRILDQISAKRVDVFLAGSKNAQARIKKIYKVESQVLYPFVDLKEFENVESFNGGYYLIIARLTKYKRVDIAIDAFRNFKGKLKIIGTGGQLNNLQNYASDNVEFLGSQSDLVLKNLIAGCKGLIVTAEEDFGMTPLESQALGKGVIAYGKGGAKETVKNKKTGILFNEQTSESLIQALFEYEALKIDPDDCKENAKTFSKDKFKKQLIKYIDDINQFDLS